MLRQQARLLIFQTIVCDVLALTVAFFCAYFLRDQLLPNVLPLWFSQPLFELAAYAWIYVAILLIWVPLFAAFNLYTSIRLRSFRRMPIDIAKASGVGLGILVMMTYTFKVQDVSRSFVLVFGVTSVVLTTIGRLIIRTSVQRRGQHEYVFSNVLVVGTGPKAQEFADLLTEHRKSGLHLVGLIAEHRLEHYPSYVGKYNVIGNVTALERIFHRQVIDEVIVVVPGKVLSEMEEIFLLCEEFGVNARIAVGIFPHLIARATLEEFAHIPLLTFSTKPTNHFALAVKRLTDLLIAWPALILGIPIWLFIAVLIRVDSKGPVFFRQERCGVNGRRFTMYKFRSMVADAEQRQYELASYNELSGPVFKMTRDPRTTRVGKFLRKTSLDEFPQILNVIRGDMAIVGPRPAIPAEVDKYERWQRRRLSMKPGLTSPWVVRGRNTIPFEQWMQLDLEYIDNWSLWFDFKIMLQTIPVILKGKGAS